MLLVVSLPSNNTAVCSHSGPFCGGAAWLQAKTGVANSIWIRHGFFLIQHMGVSWWLQKTVWGSTGAGNCIESCSVKQGARRICQSPHSSLINMFFPGSYLSPFLLSQFGVIYFVKETERAEVSDCVIPWSEGKHRVTASGCVWRVFSGKTAWHVPCLFLPLWSRIKGGLVNSDCTAFKIKTSGYKIKKKG